MQVSVGLNNCLFFMVVIFSALSVRAFIAWYENGVFVEWVRLLVRLWYGALRMSITK